MLTYWMQCCLLACLFGLPGLHWTGLVCGLACVVSSPFSGQCGWVVKAYAKVCIWSNPPPLPPPHPSPHKSLFHRGSWCYTALEIFQNKNQYLFSSQEFSLFIVPETYHTNPLQRFSWNRTKVSSTCSVQKSHHLSLSTTRACLARDKPHATMDWFKYQPIRRRVSMTDWHAPLWSRAGGRAEV